MLDPMDVEDLRPHRDEHARAADLDDLRDDERLVLDRFELVPHLIELGSELV